MTEVQKITLRDVFRQQGLSERQIEDIFLLLHHKSEKVRLAFYYRTCGLTYRDIADKIDVHYTTAQYYIKYKCIDIKKYISVGKSS